MAYIKNSYLKLYLFTNDYPFLLETLLLLARKTDFSIKKLKKH